MEDKKTNCVAEDLTATVSVEEAKSINSDDALLMAMGKKPELKRVYNFWTCKSSSASVFCLMPGTYGEHSMRVPDYDHVQLVLSRCPVLNHL